MSVHTLIATAVAMCEIVSDSIINTSTVAGWGIDPTKNAACAALIVLDYYCVRDWILFYFQHQHTGLPFSTDVWNTARNAFNS